MNLHEAICRQQHPAEWESPTPRITPCDDCKPLTAAVNTWIKASATQRKARA